MLVSPKQRSYEGENLKATLQFEKAGPLEVEFVVQKPTNADANDDHFGHQP